MATMATDTIPAQLADLHGLTLEQIAKLPTIDLSHIVPDSPSVPVASFGSAI